MTTSEKHTFNIFWTVENEPYLLVRLLMALRKYELSPVTIAMQEPEQNGRMGIQMCVRAEDSDISVAIKKAQRLVSVIDVSYENNERS